MSQHSNLQIAKCHFTDFLLTMVFLNYRCNISVMGQKLSRSEQPHKGDVQEKALDLKSTMVAVLRNLFIKVMDQKILCRNVRFRKHYVASLLRDEKRFFPFCYLYNLAHKTPWLLSLRVKRIFNIIKLNESGFSTESPD